MVQSLLASASKLSDGSSRLADSAEKLPEQLRKQALILIEEIDAKQTNLQVTLDKAEKTAATVERTVGRVDEAANSLERTAKSINQAAISWESAAEATDATIEEFKSKKDSYQGKEASFDINAYRDAAKEVDAAANTLRALIADADSLTPRLTWRVTQIIVLFFILALAYRIVVVRLVKKPK